MSTTQRVFNCHDHFWTTTQEVLHPWLWNHFWSSFSMLLNLPLTASNGYFFTAWLIKNQGEFIQEFSKSIKRTSSLKKFLHARVPHDHGLLLASCSLEESNIFTNHGCMFGWCYPFFIRPGVSTTAHANTIPHEVSWTNLLLGSTNSDTLDSWKPEPSKAPSTWTHGISGKTKTPNLHSFPLLQTSFIRKFDP